MTGPRIICHVCVKVDRYITAQEWEVQSGGLRVRVFLCDAHADHADRPVLVTSSPWKHGKLP